MIEIISGTDRPDSNTRRVAEILRQIYAKHNVSAQILDLMDLNLGELEQGGYYKGPKGTMKAAVDRVTQADGVVLVVPEYNGSYPGILKLFIDYWDYPKTFEHRPFAFVGLGGRWGGLRPVEHLQHVIGYRNGYVFPMRVFLNNIKAILKNGEIIDEPLAELLDIQCREFPLFIKALKSQKLDANSKLGALV